MFYIIYCLDKPAHNEIRLQFRQEHRSWLESQAYRVVGSGPLLTDDGSGVFGSLLIIDCDSCEDAENFARNDPYNKAGLFQSVTVTRWHRVMPA